MWLSCSESSPCLTKPTPLSQSVVRCITLCPHNHNASPRPPPPRPQARPRTSLPPKRLLQNKLTPPTQIALRKFYGISTPTSHRLLARLQINSGCLVSQLTEPQVTSLPAYLSSPATSPRPPPTPLAIPGRSNLSGDQQDVLKPGRKSGVDPLDELKIETDLRRGMAADIQHQRQVASYRGRRWVLNHNSALWVGDIRLGMSGMEGC